MDRENCDNPGRCVPFPKGVCVDQAHSFVVLCLIAIFKIRKSGSFFVVDI